MFQFATATQIVFGAGALSELPRLVRGLGSRAWLVLGQSDRHGAVVRPMLEAAGVTPTVARVSGEPTVEGVARLVGEARAAGCELVIGVGGGSVIDAAKALSALITNPGDALEFLEVVGKGRPLVAPPLPFVAVPTTAGTGAEVTKNAVLASTEHRVKVSLRSDAMLPRVALVDPMLTLGMPPALTAATGLDALTQVIEPFVSCRANPLTDALSREGITRGSRALRRAFDDGGDLEARTDMALTSLCGGLSLANAKLGAVHGFAGPIGGRFTAPHGAVCARLLPCVVERNIAALRAREPQNPALARYVDLARMLTGRPTAAAEDAVPWLHTLVSELSIPPLGHYGVSEQDIAPLVESARRSSSMQGNPIVLDDDELARVLRGAL